MRVTVEGAKTNEPQTRIELPGAVGSDPVNKQINDKSTLVHGQKNTDKVKLKKANENNRSNNNGYNFKKQDPKSYFRHFFSEFFVLLKVFEIIFSIPILIILIITSPSEVGLPHGAFYLGGGIVLTSLLVTPSLCLC